MTETALLLAPGLFRTPFAKTTHGLVRGPSRYRIVGVVDPACEGDAGVALDGDHRGIPFFDSVSDAMSHLRKAPDNCVVGVATVAGVLPDAVRNELLAAGELGIRLVNGLHSMLADDPEIAAVVERRGGAVLDLRKPAPTKDLHFWSGEILSISTPRIAVIGTDCALGKRTTCSLLTEACRSAGIRAEMIYTGQTGWLQGHPHGFILDATPNDFVCGELEAAILDCERETEPDVILIEGQAALRHPAGPCGSELIVAGGASWVVLQHAPGREFYEDLEDLGCRIAPLVEEIELVRLLGGKVVAVALNEEGLEGAAMEAAHRQIAAETGLPVVRPLAGEIDRLLAVVDGLLGERR